MTASLPCSDELDRALLDVKNRVRDVSLRKDNLILVIIGYRFPLADLGKKLLRIKQGLAPLRHKDSPLARRPQGKA
jgi:hypothetical protein